MQIVLDVADEFKPVLDELPLLLRVVQAKVEEIRTGPAPDYAAIERELAARTAAIEAESHGVLLRAVDLDAPRILVGGDVHRRVGRHAATYYTAAGPVVVDRSIYLATDGRGGRTVDLVSLPLVAVRPSPRRGSVATWRSNGCPRCWSRSSRSRRRRSRRRRGSCGGTWLPSTARRPR